MTRRPNILLFMPDQLRADSVGAFGNPVVQTPNIDALAARGTKFTNAYSQHSVCSPSRASIMTGWYPHVAGHRTLTHLVKPHEPNMLKMLKAAGYKVIWAGARGDTFAKGVVEESTDHYGFTVWPKMMYESNHEPGHEKWARAHYHGKRIGKNGDGSGPFLDFDEAAVQSAEAFIREPTDEPWVMLVALIFPHPAFEVEEPWFSLHKRDDIPRRAKTDLATKPKFMAGLFDKHGWDRLSDDDFAEIRATYYGMISRVDDQLGRLQKALADVGQKDNTITAFFTDHGEYAGDFGLVEKFPAGLDDCLLRNPLIMAGPGIGEGQSSEAMVEMVDLLPTLADIAETKTEHSHFGKSLTPLFGNPDAAHKDAAFSEGGMSLSEEHLMEYAKFPYDLKAELQHEDPEANGRCISMRTKDWTYIYRLHESDELYDRKTDLLEETNLINDPTHGDLCKEMKDAILNWLVATSDVVPWQQDSRF